MIESEYETALKIARKKQELLINQVPSSIQKREDSLYQKLVSSKRNRIKKLQILFSEMEKIYTYIHKFTACKKGCNHCCHYEITISVLETEYIKRNIKDSKISKNLTQNSCPFLKQGICSIYEYRPYLCRRHVSINDSAKWCETEICHKYNFPLVSLSEVDKCYAYIIGPNGQDTIKDIRVAFNMA